jgi:hypothetical protein
LGDHSETTQIDFDPSKTSYEKLLEVFWSSHNPCSSPYSRQYMSALFTHDEAQKKIALETKAREEARRGKKIQTEIAPHTRFWRAEDYHQKYYLRQTRDLARELAAIYPEPRDFADSTAATRLNGYLGGHGSFEDLKAEIDSLGLSAQARAKLFSWVERRSRR